MEQSYLIQGRYVSEPDLALVRSLIEANPGWSRRRISVALAEAWNWRTATGQIKDMATRSLLLKHNQSKCYLENKFTLASPQSLHSHSCAKQLKRVKISGCGEHCGE